MILAPALLGAVIAELERSLGADDRAHTEAVLARATLDEFIRVTAEARVDKRHLIEQLRQLQQADPHAAKTPLPPPPLDPPPPPGATPPRGLTPPPRRKP